MKSKINSIMELISQFNDHVSIKKSYLQIIPNTFRFSPVSLRDVKNKILNLNVKTPSSSKSRLVTILKESAQIYLPY